tara:strand:- start:4408 stop:7851 length:3444 start_codon:yes stop_codon:yes gene_type:complete
VPGEFGWAYVVGARAGGVSGSVQSATEDHELTGSTKLIYNDASGTLDLTGSFNVSGTITANQYNVNIINKTVSNISASGDTKFGDSVDDHHIVTGSMYITGSTPLNIVGLQAGTGASAHYLALDSNNNVILTSSAGGGGGGGIIDEYTNPGDNRIITSIDSSGINAEANLTFDGSLLNVTGKITSSVGISSSVGQYLALSGTHVLTTTLTDGTATLAGGNLLGAGTVSGSSLGGHLITPQQPNVTLIGTLSQLNVTGDVSASALFVSASNERVGIGTNSPERRLEVYDKTDQLRLTYSKYIPFLESNVHTDLATTSDGYLILSSSGQRVGIGTTSPTKMLDVNGDMRVGGNVYITGTLSAKVTDFVVSADSITFGNSATDALTFKAATASVPNDLNFQSGLLAINSSTNKVGVGVQYPDNKLEVLDTATQLKLSYDQSNASSFTVASDGDLTIGTTGTSITASADLFVDGELTFVGALTSSTGFSGSQGNFNSLTASFAKFESVNVGNIDITPTLISGATTINGDNLVGTLTTAAQTNITSVGTLTSLNVAGNLSSSVLYDNSSTQRVGIGRTDPVRKLEVITTEPQLRLSYTDFELFGTEDIYTDVYTNSDGYLIFSASGNRVGIGTSSPTQMLDVDGNVRVGGNLYVTGSLNAKVTDFIVSANNITFGDSSTDVLTFNAATASLTTGLNFDSNLLTLNPSNLGRVGIGVELPSDKLEIRATSGNQLRLSYNASNLATFAVASNGDLNVSASGQWITSSTGLFVSASSYLGATTSDHTIVSGQLTASYGLSSSIGQFTQVTASYLRGSTITDGTATMTGGNITGVGTLNATYLGGALTTAAQPSVTSLGSLTSLTVTGDLTASSTLYVGSTATTVGIGVTDAQKPLEILGTSGQLRLTHQRATGFPDNDPHRFSDIYSDSNGYLILTASSHNVGIGTASPSAVLHVAGDVYFSASSNPIKLGGLQSGSLAGNGSYLGVNAAGVVVLTASSGGGGGGGGSVNGAANLGSGTGVFAQLSGDSLQFKSLIAGAGIELSATSTEITLASTASAGVFSRRVVSSTITASASDYYIGISASSNLIVQLLDASDLSAGQTLVIKDERGSADSHTLEIKASGSQTIDGEQSVYLESPYAALNLYTDGTSKYFIF